MFKFIKSLFSAAQNSERNSIINTDGKAYKTKAPDSISKQVKNDDWPDNIDSLLKIATSLKKNDPALGAEVLRKAYQLAENETVAYPVDTFLRLPMFLQLAGKNDEAWAEYNRLLAEGFPSEIKSNEMLYVNHSAIYDKMRLFLEREKKPIQAVKFGVYSHVCWCLGMYYQKRESDLKKCTSDEAVEGCVSSLLKKAKKLECGDSIQKIVKTSLEKIPQIRLSELGESIDRALKTSSS